MRKITLHKLVGFVSASANSGSLSGGIYGAISPSLEPLASRSRPSARTSVYTDNASSGEPGGQANHEHRAPNGTTRGFLPPVLSAKASKPIPVPPLLELTC